MWKLVENSTNEKPSSVDTESSQSVVYVRKDFEEVNNYDEDMNVTGTHWRYLEKEVKKADWETYKEVLQGQSEMTDIQIALTELYEMVVK